MSFAHRQKGFGQTTPLVSETSSCFCSLACSYIDHQYMGTDAFVSIARELSNGDSRPKTKVLVRLDLRCYTLIASTLQVLLAHAQ